MSYKTWFVQHSLKHQDIIKKLQHLNQNEIIEYFLYDNMKNKEIDFCPLYKDNKKCHNIKDLNCFLCGCPNFRLTSLKSYCNINSKDGASIKGKDGFIHQDCSSCNIPHKNNFINKNFNTNWNYIMKDVL